MNTDNFLPYRKDCNCDCHDGGLAHMVPCCRPDPEPKLSVKQFEGTAIKHLQVKSGDVVLVQIDPELADQDVRLDPGIGDYFKDLSEKTGIHFVVTVGLVYTVIKKGELES